MPFEKGHKKTGGRVKGGTNKVTARNRLVWDMILFECKDDIISHIKLLFKNNPKEAVKLILTISKDLTAETAEDQFIISMIDEIVDNIKASQL